MEIPMLYIVEACGCCGDDKVLNRTRKKATIECTKLTSLNRSLHQILHKRRRRDGLSRDAAVDDLLI